jgi:hypothetical protein
LTVCTLELHDGLGDEVEGIRQFHRPFGLEVTIKIAHLIAHVQKCQGTISPDLPKYPNSPRGSLGGSVLERMSLQSFPALLRGGLDV